jgi:hypothetical protein
MSGEFLDFHGRQIHLGDTVTARVMGGYAWLLYGYEGTVTGFGRTRIKVAVEGAPRVYSVLSETVTVESSS